MKIPKTFTVCLQTLGILCLPAISTFAQEYSPQGDLTAGPPPGAARISYLKGSVSFQPAGQEQWSEASLNFTVTTGDRIYTDRGSRAELQVGPYAIRLSEKTDLEITNPPHPPPMPRVRPAAPARLEKRK
jgi:hypothetical protein